MVQKSGVQQLRLVVYHSIYKVFKMFLHPYFFHQQYHEVEGPGLKNNIKFNSLLKDKEFDIPVGNRGILKYDTGFMMSIGFFNDSWRNTGLMTCSTWENWVVQPLCKLTNQYERVTAQSVFGGACAKKCCSCYSRNTHGPSQCLKQPLLVQTDV